MSRWLGGCGFQIAEFDKALGEPLLAFASYHRRESEVSLIVVSAGSFLDGEVTALDVLLKRQVVTIATTHEDAMLTQSAEQHVLAEAHGAGVVADIHALIVTCNTISKIGLWCLNGDCCLCLIQFHSQTTASSRAAA